jgi:hypothetical protein
MRRGSTVRLCDNARLAQGRPDPGFRPAVMAPLLITRTFQRIRLKSPGDHETGASAGAAAGRATGPRDRAAVARGQPYWRTTAWTVLPGLLTAWVKPPPIMIAVPGTRATDSTLIWRGPAGSATEVSLPPE